MGNKISVAMCTYNGARYLREQLASLAAQTRTPDELVVCDDNSRDETREIVAEFAAAAPFPVRLHVNEHNLGSTKNFEKAIGLCAGDIIALSDQDDVWLPEKLRLIEEVLDARPEVGLVFTDAQMVDAELRPLNDRLWPPIGFDAAAQRMVSDGQAFELLMTTNVVTGAATAFRSKYRELVLPIPPNDIYIHDGWIALIISAVAPLAFVDAPTMLYRQHAGQQLGVPVDARTAVRPPVEVESNLVRHLAQAAQRRQPFAPDIYRHRLVYDRLIARRADFDCRACLDKIGPRLAHMEARATLPDAKLNRVPRVLRELCSIRYHQYSSGLRSAVKDIFL